MLCHYWKLQTQESAGASGMKAPSGGGGRSHPGGAYNQVFDFGAPKTKGGGVKIV